MSRVRLRVASVTPFYIWHLLWYQKARRTTHTYIYNIYIERERHGAIDITRRAHLTRNKVYSNLLLDNFSLRYPILMPTISHLAFFTAIVIILPPPSLPLPTN